VYLTTLNVIMNVSVSLCGRNNVELYKVIKHIKFGFLKYN